jgi:predicted acylesterase/phospholipase RssA
MANAKTGLVLQGGGALGAFEYGAIRWMHEHEQFSPDVIAGVSIGAINAACLVGARGEPMETLCELWERFAVTSPPFMPESAQRFLALFGNTSFYRMRWDSVALPFWTSFYDTAILRRVLEEFIDFDTLNNSRTTLFVSATDIETGEIVHFGNHTTGIGPEHIMASGALPPGFPMVRVDGRHCWDGGLFNNTPLAPVIEELDPDENVEKQIVVMNLFPNRGRVPTNMLEVLDRAFEIVFSNKLQMDVKTAKKVDEFVEVLQEIERHLPEDVMRRLGDNPAYQHMKKYKLIKNLITITDDSATPVFGPFDFSRASIAARIAAGQEAAESAFHRHREQVERRVAQPAGAAG